MALLHHFVSVVLLTIRWTILLTVLGLVNSLPVDNGNNDNSRDASGGNNLAKVFATTDHSTVHSAHQAPLPDTESEANTLAFGERFRQIEDQLPEYDELVLHDQITNAILILVYGILIVVSLIGNTLVCRVLLCAKRSAYPTLNITTGTGTSKILIVNLAVSDLLLTTFNIPINLVRFVSRDWPFGELICTMMPFVQSVSAYCSAWTMMVIAFERYRKILQQRNFHRMQQKKSANSAVQLCTDHQHLMVNGTARRSMEVSLTTGQPQHQHILLDKITPNVWAIVGKHLHGLYGRVCYSFCLGCCCCCPTAVIPATPTSLAGSSHNCGPVGKCRRRLPAWLILSLVWLISFALALPHAQYTQLTHYDIVNTISMTRCTINNYPDTKTKQFLTWYTTISQYMLPIGLTSFFYLHIGFFLWRRETVGALSEGRRLFLLKRKRRRVRMLMLVVAVFAACWFPLTVYLVATDLGYITHHQLFFFAVHWFAMSSVCYNPFIYCWLNEAFRHKTKAILKCFLPSHCWSACTGRPISSHIPSVSERLKNGHHRNGRRKSGGGGGGGAGVGNGSPFYGPNGRDSDNKATDTSWSSTTMSATGKQQAISELISMSALIEQDLLDSSTRYSHTNTANRNYPYTKEQRLALSTTQSGRRRHHPLRESQQLIMMMKMSEEPTTATKTTSINLVSSASSSSSIELEQTQNPSTQSQQTAGDTTLCNNNTTSNSTTEQTNQSATNNQQPNKEPL